MNFQTIVNFVQKAFKIYQDVQNESSQHQESSRSSARSSDYNNRAPRPTQDYPGDYKGHVNFQYSPVDNHQPDPGEVVWAWVPFEEDYSQGKDRPVLIIGKNGGYYLTLMLTSKDHNNPNHHDSRYLDIGSGAWDKSGRPSEINLGRIIQIEEDKIRREGSTVDSATFTKIQRAFENHHGA